MRHDLTDFEGFTNFEVQRGCSYKLQDGRDFAKGRDLPLMESHKIKTCVCD